MEYAIEKILNRTDDPEKWELWFYGYVGYYPLTEGVVVGAIRYAKKEGCKTLVLRVHSPGGDIATGVGIIGAIRAVAPEMKIEGMVDGIAYSMATVILQECSRIRMNDTGMWMVHNPLGGARGDAAQLRKAADQLEQWQTVLRECYVRRTGMSTEEIQKLMDADTFITPQDSVKKGFVDEVVSTSVVSGLPKVDPQALDDFSGAVALYHGPDGFWSEHFEEMPPVEPHGHQIKAQATPTSEPINSPYQINMGVKIDAVVAAAGLPADTNEGTLLAQLTALRQERDNLRAQKKAAEQEHRAGIIADAVAQGKILASDVKTYESLDPLTCEKILGTIPARADLTKKIVAAGGGSEKDNWDFHGWMKNDPQGFQALKESDPVKYNQIIAAIGSETQNG